MGRVNVASVPRLHGKSPASERRGPAKESRRTRGYVCGKVQHKEGNGTRPGGQ